jgi:hypothetical protein
VRCSDELFGNAQDRCPVSAQHLVDMPDSFRAQVDFVDLAYEVEAEPVVPLLVDKLEAAVRAMVRVD